MTSTENPFAVAGTASARAKAPDFSLVLGGPLFQLFRRAHLSDDALTLAKKRVVVIVAILWLPLFVIAAVQGNLLSSAVPVPFLLDLEVHIRFLVSLPLLIAAELFVHKRMRTVVQQFRERELIPEKDESRFEAAVQAAFRLRNSTPAELLLVAFVYLVGVEVVFKRYTVLQAATWYVTPTASGMDFSAAGYWFCYVSVPFFQFLLLRWYFRIFIWARFLWQVSRIELRLVPTHPDRLGGIGFLAATAHAFSPLAAAHGAMVAAQFASRIFHTGAKLTDFKALAFVLVVVMVIMVFGPLLVFSGQLVETQRKGLREYGTLAQKYVRDFDSKWLRGGAPTDEAFVGSGDIQSLADLEGSFDIVRTMRIVLWTKEALLRLAMVTIAPMVPLALTMMPAEELLKQIFGILF